MALFQKSVLTNYLSSISHNEINNGWVNFQNYKSIASNIKNYKEEDMPIV